MDLSNLPRIFTVRPSGEPPLAESSSNGKIASLLKPEAYRNEGFHRAGRHGGSTDGLAVCLQTIVHEREQAMRHDNEKQNKLMGPYRERMRGHEHERDRMMQEVKDIKEQRIPRIKERIAALRLEISAIKENPKAQIGQESSRAGFIIGSAILLFLTVYLFIFYSSASYSAFFRTFEITNIGVANSIFDPQAIPKGLAEGVTELALILTIPFVFIGLGYLIHNVQQAKGWGKYPKVTLLILVTFAFDAILAFEITRKIYDIKRQGSFTPLPDYNSHMAIQDAQFWMIIFAGFVVYLIWGLVFDQVMDAYGKLDIIGTAIRERHKKIANAEREVEALEKEEQNKLAEANEHKKQAIKLNDFIESGYVVTKDFELCLYQFGEGWTTWMKHSGMSEEDIGPARNRVKDFVRNVTAAPSVNNNYA